LPQSGHGMRANIRSFCDFGLLSYGVSQTEMVRRLGVEDSIAYHRISEYETGKREPPLLILLEYARVAGVCLDALADDKVQLPAKLPREPKHKLY
jgi:transcriptional regulator with XRE-family HTH domain